MKPKSATNRICRLLSVLTACSLLLAGFTPIRAEAAAAPAPTDKTLTVATAKSMALAQSSEYVQLKNKLDLAKLQYSQAIKAIKLKEKTREPSAGHRY